MDKVLIVEDNPVLLKILQSGLKKYEDRFAAVMARDGEEAIEVLGREPISLMVTDLQMPKVDGLTLLTYMNDHYPEIPCVVMSAHGTPQIKEKISSDVLKFIEKPFEIEELVETILPTLEGGEPGGMMKGISIANFLQMIHMEQKTCLLEIETQDEKKGYFYFEEGILFDAVFEDLKGEDAAIAIIPHDRAKIQLKNLATGKKKVTRRIEKDLMALIMDAMRLKDEGEKAAAESGAGDFISEPEEQIKDADDFLADLDEEFALLDQDGQEFEPPPETAPGPAEPQPTAEPDFDGSMQTTCPPEAANSHIESILCGLRDVNGYRGAAVLDTSGDVLVRDASQPDLDVSLYAAFALDLVLSARKVAEKTGLGRQKELIFTAEKGILLFASVGQEAGEEIHVMVVLGRDGNQAMAKIALKKVLPAITAALS